MSYNLPTSLFSELLDVNYEIETNENLTSLEKGELFVRYVKLKELIVGIMGEENWMRFIKDGEEMFRKS